MIKYKIGDKVRLIAGTEYSDQSDSAGTILEDTSGEIYEDWVSVKWDKKKAGFQRTDNYPIGDLELEVAKEKKTKEKIIEINWNNIKSNGK